MKFKKINWIVRIKNKAFWVALIPAVLMLIQMLAAVFGDPEPGRLGQAACSCQFVICRACDSGNRDRPDNGGRGRQRESTYI